MTENHSTPSARHRKPAKPKKPSKDYPLFAHNNGQWAKKVRGKIHFFGVWLDPQKALEKWLAEKDDLLAGRKPRAASEGFTLRDLNNRYLTHKRHLLDTHELAQRTWDEYYETCERLVKTFGGGRVVADLSADDFEKLRGHLSKTWGPVRLANEIQRVRSVFKYGFDSGLIEKPVRFGPGFKRPSKKTLRVNRAAKGVRMFEAAEMWQLLDEAGQPMKAMILLAINCGYGNTDCGKLPLSALDLDAGWVDYPRPKTGIARRCPLWPETIAALQEWLQERPAPKEEADTGLVFVTKYGQSWAKISTDQPISKEMTKLVKRLKITGHKNFYGIRHTFETIAGEAKDQVAVNAVMGHCPEDMSSVYRERISDQRLRDVTEYVRRWLFSAKEEAAA